VSLRRVRLQWLRNRLCGLGLLNSSPGGLDALQVCHISYARIQGRGALISHFQNSSLMHEDKRCRPVLFRSEGGFAGEQEPFPVGPNARPRAAQAGREGRLSPQA